MEDLVRRLRVWDGGLDAEALQSMVFAVGKDHGFEPLRDWFTALYEVLLGASQGPRFGGFIALYGVNETIGLIETALAGRQDVAEDGAPVELPVEHDVDDQMRQRVPEHRQPEHAAETQQSQARPAQQRRYRKCRQHEPQCPKAKRLFERAHRIGAELAGHRLPEGPHPRHQRHEVERQHRHAFECVVEKIDGP